MWLISLDARLRGHDEYGVIQRFLSGYTAFNKVSNKSRATAIMRELAL